GDFGRALALAGEQAHGLGHADAVQHALQRVRGQVREECLLPRLLDPREGELHARDVRSEEHTSELQSPCNIVCRLLLEKKKHGGWWLLFSILSSLHTVGCVRFSLVCACCY